MTEARQRLAGGGASTGCAFSGAATAATLAGPSAVAVDASGSVYVADTTNNCIRKVTSGAISLFAGGGATDRVLRRQESRRPSR